MQALLWLKVVRRDKTFVDLAKDKGAYQILRSGWVGDGSDARGFDSLPHRPEHKASPPGWAFFFDLWPTIWNPAKQQQGTVMMNTFKNWLLSDIEGDTRLGLIVATMTMVGCPAFLLWLCS